MIERGVHARRASPRTRVHGTHARRFFSRRAQSNPCRTISVESFPRRHPALSDRTRKTSSADHHVTSVDVTSTYPLPLSRRRRLHEHALEKRKAHVERKEPDAHGSLKPSREQHPVLHPARLPEPGHAAGGRHAEDQAGKGWRRGRRGQGRGGGAGGQGTGQGKGARARRVIWCFRAPFWNRTVEPYFGTVLWNRTESGAGPGKIFECASR